jgi:cytochrome c-type biogenesis protein CcmF
MELAQLGAGALLAGLALALFAAGVSVVAARVQSAHLARVGRRALHASAITVAGAAACLLAGFVRHDFSIAFVAEHSDRSTPTPLLVAALYGGQEGSLLYWTLLLAVIGSVAVAGAGGGRVAAYAAAVLAGIEAFFLVVLVFVASPFAVLDPAPPDGIGLNPILRDGGMLVHPPFLLAGFSSFAIPFAFAMGSLLAGRPDASWIAYTRRLALLAWGLQTVGLTLGMWWAYHVLGWGGYWGWDPVENVALLPWLATTAYIHSAQVQERRGTLRGWNYGLVITAYCLAVFGTFVVRSGVVQSVHSFAVSAIGPWFLAFLAVSVTFAFTVLAIRAPLLRSIRPVETAVSREGAFLLNNVLLLLLAAAVLWGTVLPLVSGFIAGRQSVVGPPYYESVTAPLFTLLLALLAVGPLVPWRRAGRTWLRALRVPVLAAAGSLAALAAAGVRQWPALLVGPVLAAAAATSLREYARGVAYAGRLPGSRAGAALRLAARNRRRYAAYLAHVGIVVAACGIAASHIWQVERALVLRPGDRVTVGRHQLTYFGSAERRAGDRVEVVAEMRADDSILRPSRTTHVDWGGTTTTGVAISSSPIDDLYVVLAGSNPDGSSALRVLVNPLVTWIWAGGALLVAGVLIGNLGGPVRAPDPAAAPLRRPALAAGGGG